MSAIAAATTAIDTPERTGKTFSIPVAAATLIPAGVLVAEDASGNAINASDAAAIRVVGRCEQDVDNSAGAAGDLNAIVKEGVFKFTNSDDQPVTAAYKGKLVFVESNKAVAITSTNKCKAGLCVDFESDGVWVDTRYAHLLTTVIADTTTNGEFTTQGTASTAAADLAALKVVVTAACAEAEKLGDLTRAILAALKTNGIAV